MKYKDCCINKITITVLIILLGLSLICTMSFWLEQWFNLNNPITTELWCIYWKVYPVWISIIVAFFNILCACTNIQIICGERKKPFKKWIIYTGISLLAFVSHCITSDYIFGCVIASV